LPDLIAMLRSLERHVRRLPARSISFNVLGAPRLRRALESLGYRARESNRKVICSPGARAPQAARRLTNEHDWYLTDADEDQ
jgi:hypothetical protein